MNTTNQTNEQNKNVRPQVGKIITIRGHVCNIIAVHEFGTIDVMCGDRAWRVTGLKFI